MKAFRLMMMAGLLAIAGAAHADEVTVLTAEDVVIKNGETANLVVKMDYDTPETLIGFNFSLVLPEGIDFDCDEWRKANGGKISNLKKVLDYGDVLEEDVAASGMKLQERADGGMLFTWIDNDDKTELIKGETGYHGTLLIIPLKATAEVSSTTCSLTSIGLSNNLDQGFATFGKGATIADAVFNINADTDGINEVKTAQDNGAIYNVAGQRLDKAGKGLYIQNGKKYVK